jgi:hypothetical protein
MHFTRRSDTLRNIWINHLLPTVLKEGFLLSVINDDVKMFQFGLPAELDDSLPWNTLSHIAAFQNLAYLAPREVGARHVPWQFRVELAQEAASRLVALPIEVEMELAALFKAQQWKFWLTETGFCIAPLSLFAELDALASMYIGWKEMRDFRGSGFLQAEDDEAAKTLLWAKADHDRAAAMQRRPDTPPPPPFDMEMPRLEGLDNVTGNYHHENPNQSGGSNAASGSLRSAAAAGGGTA